MLNAFVNLDHSTGRTLYPVSHDTIKIVDVQLGTLLPPNTEPTTPAGMYLVRLQYAERRDAKITTQKDWLTFVAALEAADSDFITLKTIVPNTDTPLGVCVFRRSTIERVSISSPQEGPAKRRVTVSLDLNVALILPHKTRHIDLQAFRGEARKFGDALATSAASNSG